MDDEGSILIPLLSVLTRRQDECSTEVLSREEIRPAPKQLVRRVLASLLHALSVRQSDMCLVRLFEGAIDFLRRYGARVFVSAVGDWMQVISARTIEGRRREVALCSGIYGLLFSRFREVQYNTRVCKPRSEGLLPQEIHEIHGVSSSKPHVWMCRGGDIGHVASRTRRPWNGVWFVAARASSKQ